MADEEWPAYVTLFGLGLIAFIIACVVTKGVAALITALVIACVLAAA